MQKKNKGNILLPLPFDMQTDASFFSKEIVNNCSNHTNVSLFFSLEKSHRIRLSLSPTYCSIPRAQLASSMSTTAADVNGFPNCNAKHTFAGFHVN